MRARRVQEVGRQVPIGDVTLDAVQASGIEGRGAGTAVDSGPLRVVKDVEELAPELESLGLAHGKALEQPHIEVGAARHVERVAARVPKREAGRLLVGAWVKQKRPYHSYLIPFVRWHGSVGIAHQIGVGS